MKSKTSKIKVKRTRKKKYGEPTMVATFRFPVSKEIEIRYTIKKLLESWLDKK